MSYHSNHYIIPIIIFFCNKFVSFKDNTNNNYRLISAMPYHTYTQASHYKYTLHEWNMHYIPILETIFKYDEIKIIYDIGANVGGTTSIFLNYAYKNNKNIDKIVCFEPDDENMNFLKNTLSSFIKIDQVKPIHKGVFYGLTESTVAVHSWSVNPNIGGYSVKHISDESVKIANIQRQLDNIPLVTSEIVPNKVFYLDTLENLYDIHSLSKPDFIKMDIEGSEVNVITNSVKNSDIINHAKFIILEWNNQSSTIEDFVKKYLPEFDVLFSKTPNTDPVLIKKNIRHKYKCI